MTDLDMWSGIVGFVAPAVVAVIVRSAWPSWARALVTLAVCVAGGGITAALTGNLEGASPARAVLVVLFTALAFYRLWWHPSTIAPKIEAATSPEPAGLESHLHRHAFEGARPPGRVSSAAPLPPRGPTPPATPPTNSGRTPYGDDHLNWTR